ncbi:hypothetical protein BDN70DRAFT_938774 [Pholiota conissans]|uniref:BTB domain-containing protein n=1 Tax=Pholiota conissans TaxID=109636 RepID=A0A9P5YLU6_9AGAR|nr:hypothetical protein BDN70DRAFT_938774 [Pholiota conissans]
MTTGVDVHGKAPDTTTAVQKPVTSNQAVPHNKKILTKDKTYWIEEEFFVFQVENTMFRVPSYPFAKSRTFLAMRGFPNMLFDENIIGWGGYTLENVTVKEFRTLLDVLEIYPKPPNKNLISGLSKDELISVLKLSTMWHFTEHRKAAIAQLSRILPSVSKIELGIKYRIAAFWNFGIEYLITRLEQITDDEAVLMGPLIAVALFRLRETWKLSKKAERTDATLRALIAAEVSFSNELIAIEEDERRFDECSTEAAS